MSLSIWPKMLTLFILYVNLIVVVTFYNFTACLLDEQEAPLSQRDRTMLYVIKYFAESLKVIRNDTVE